MSRFQLEVEIRIPRTLELLHFNHRKICTAKVDERFDLLGNIRMNNQSVEDVFLQRAQSVEVEKEGAKRKTR